MDLAVAVYELLNNLPDIEKFGLCDQMRRSSVSLPSNIAEGCGRGTKKDFNHFLHIALGSLFELETQLILCVRLKYLSESELIHINDLIKIIGKMLNRLIYSNKEKNQ